MMNSLEFIDELKIRTCKNFSTMKNLSESLYTQLLIRFFSFK